MTSGWKRLIMIVWNDQSAKFLLEECFISHPSSLCKQESHLPQKKLIEADNMMTCFFTFDAIMNMNKTVMYMKGLYRAWVCHAMAMNDYLLSFCRHIKGRQVRGHIRRLLEATSELLKPLTASIEESRCDKPLTSVYRSVIVQYLSACNLRNSDLSTT